EPDNALVNGNLDAAAHLVARGAPLTLSSALCLGYFDRAAALAPGATRGQKQFALTMSALRGNAAALSAAIGFGVDLAAPSPDLYPHATALHHAVGSGSLEAVRALVEAGAPLGVKDTVYDGTPFEWAEFGKKTEIAAYLKQRGAR
ncbi:MAG TPA: ankyrin repeat domain-containing protein, partial [Vicinamibacterales bacterium]|nr:ankyrin repeat domain-containing protein [Vicinamibacterales bacterium]